MLNRSLPSVLSLRLNVNSNVTSFRWLLLASLALMTTLCTEAQQTRPIVNLFHHKDRPVVGIPLIGSLKQKRLIDSISTASGQATIENGRVTGIKITESGHYPLTGKLRVVFSGGGGSGASVTVETGITLHSSDAHAYGQEVTGFRITNPGSGYTSAPVVTFVFQ